MAERLLNRYMTTKLTFIGDCIEGIEYCDDATEMAQLVDRGEAITLGHFETLSAVPDFITTKFKKSKHTLSFWYSKEDNISWIYDEDDDIHYFFG
jgi:hypothetical protein